jgi:osmotically inducible protein OsmC
MGISKGSAEWTGTLKTGSGTMKPAHATEANFSLGTRFDGASGSNPEELIGAALSGCFSMALAANLEKAGMKPVQIQTKADVHLEKQGEGFSIAKIELTTSIRAPGADAAKVDEVAQETKKTCPVSKALSGTTITLKANLA